MMSDLESLVHFLHRASGLVLDPQKAYLIEGRLSPFMQRAGIRDMAELLNQLHRGDKVLKQSVIDAMMTNETFFFRDRLPFQNFRTVILPLLIETRRKQRSLRIWSAAASSGQEPYSIAMMLDQEKEKLAGWSVEILATDLSHTAIESARRGRYSQFEVQRGLPVSHLMRYFDKDGEAWQIKDHLRAKVRFEHHNLLDNFETLGVFDVIFCRNVLIYFDLTTRKNILQRMGHALADHGFFIMGSAETVLGLSDTLSPHPDLRLVSTHRAMPPLSQGSLSRHAFH
jgi:chemotaxis protein methyltransferase CheR